jgi:dTDP-4-dehydrorhamnose 3,5-epimerase
MRFEPTDVDGVWLITLERITDERGHFARVFCAREFGDRGLNPACVQCSVSYNAKRGTLRGMHYQAPPHAEAKLVRVTRGAIYDVAIDLRRSSATFKKWCGVELTGANGRALYIPEQCAHGFITLTDETEVFYQMSEFYYPGEARGVRWDDPALGVRWPSEPALISQRDAGYANFNEAGTKHV